jgi:hypothetical protein
MAAAWGNVQLRKFLLTQVAAKVGSQFVSAAAKSAVRGGTLIAALYLPKAGWDLGLGIRQAIDAPGIARENAARVIIGNVKLLAAAIARQNVPVYGSALNEKGRNELMSKEDEWLGEDWKQQLVLGGVDALAEGRYRALVFIATRVAFLANGYTEVYNNPENWQ